MASLQVYWIRCHYIYGAHTLIDIYRVLNMLHVFRKSELTKFESGYTKDYVAQGGFIFVDKYSYFSVFFKSFKIIIFK